MQGALPNIPRPFTVPSLAERWGCSTGLVRKMIDRGQLRSFRIGALIRIPADEVERVECLTTPSSDSEVHMPSSGETTDSGGGEGSTPKIDRARKPRLDVSGRTATIHRGPWAD
jgi:excisionase family DNA binding protein